MSQFQFSEYMLLRRSDAQAAEEMLANATEEDQRLCRTLGSMERSAEMPVPPVGGLPRRTMLLVFAPAILAAVVLVPLWIAEVPTLRSDLAQAKAEVGPLRQSLERSTTDLAAARAEISRSAAAITAVKADLARSLVEVEALKKEVSRLRDGQASGPVWTLRIDRVRVRFREPLVSPSLSMALRFEVRIGESVLKRQGTVDFRAGEGSTWTSEDASLALDLPPGFRNAQTIEITVSAGDFQFMAREQLSVDRLVRGDALLVALEDPSRDAQLDLVLRVARQ